MFFDAAPHENPKKNAQPAPGIVRADRFSEKLLPRIRWNFPAANASGSLMRALMLSPEPLLLDERWARSIRWCALRCKRSQEIFTRLGQTVVFCHHDLAEAIYFADDIVP